MAAYAGGECVLDVCAGPHLTRDSLLVPYSSSKVTIGLTIGLLVQRQALELDRTVASYWPAFAQAGKAEVTVRQLLSHQAGVPETWPPLTGPRGRMCTWGSRPTSSTDWCRCCR